VSRLRAFTLGAFTSTAVAVIQVLLFASGPAPVLLGDSWSLLMGGAVIASGLFGGLIGAYVSAYRDLSAEVAGYCRPVPKGSSR
jgi:hypothetical protein